MAWTIYYAMLAAHVLGGGYTLFWGKTVHRLVLLVVALTIVVQFAGVAILAVRHIPLADGRLSLDLIDNTFEACSLVVLALCFPRENWLIAMLLLQSVNMVADAFVFPDESLMMRNAMVDTANLLNIAEVSLMVWAAARARVARPADGQATGVVHLTAT